MSSTKNASDAIGVNPKDLAGQAKPDLSLVTRAMMEAIAAALKNGVAKYGRNNWRSTPVKALVYTAAAMRHIKAWEDGEDFAPDSGVHHLDHAIASLAIMRDAEAFGTLVDNRVLGRGRRRTAPASEPRYGVFRADGGRSRDLPGEYDSRLQAENVVRIYSAAAHMPMHVKELP